MGMIRTHVFLHKKALEALRALAEATGLSVAEHIRRAIDAYLKQHTNTVGQRGKP